MDVISKIRIGAHISTLLAVVLTFVDYIVVVVKLCRASVIWYNALFLMDEYEDVTRALPQRPMELFNDIIWFKIACVLLIVAQLLHIVAYMINFGGIRAILLPIFSLIGAVGVALITLDSLNIVPVYDQKQFFNIDQKTYEIMVISLLVVATIGRLVLYAICNGEGYLRSNIQLFVRSLFVLGACHLSVIGLMFLAMFIILCIVSILPLPGDFQEKRDAVFDSAGNFIGWFIDMR